MRKITIPMAIASMAIAVALGQLLPPQAGVPTQEATFHDTSVHHTQLAGLECLTKKLILPDKKEDPGDSLALALAQYGE